MSEDGPEDEGVLDTDDLDVRTDERVVELDENRFFVSTSGDAPEPRTGAPARDAGPEPEAARSEADRTPLGDDPAAPAGDRPLRDALEGVDGTYAIAAAVRTDDGTAERVVGTDNVAATFEAFVRWYAGEVGDGRATPAEVVRVLLRESDLEP